MSLPIEDLSSWPREGPVRVLQGGTWRRKNGPIACEACRKRRVRCSGFETGAPCDNCNRRSTSCIVGDDSYAHDAAHQTILFKAILPPPPIPCSTPEEQEEEDGYEEEETSLDHDSLVQALKDSSPRPAPLVWKASPEELASSSTPTTRTRKRASPPSSASTAAAIKSKPTPKHRRAPLMKKQQAESSESDVDEDEFADEIDFRPKTTSKRRRAGESAGDVGEGEAEEGDERVVEAALALFDLKRGGLVSISSWKATGREERGKFIGAYDPGLPNTFFPLSSVRDELPPISSTSSYDLPSGSSTANQSRRASLLSTTSTSTSASNESVETATTSLMDEPARMEGCESA